MFTVIKEGLCMVTVIQRNMSPPVPAFFPFWLIWYINRRALYSRALSIIVVGVVVCAHITLLATGLDIETSYLV